MKNLFKQAINQAFSDLFPESPEPSQDILRPKPGFGDYSSNIALKMAKKVEGVTNPQELAEKIAAKVKELDQDGSFSKVEAISGFVNVHLSQKSLSQNLKSLLESDSQSEITKPGRVLIEYFQNNVAKPPHIGHLRAAVIGDSLKRVFKYLGYDTVSDTHVGDWGTQFGILLYAFKTLGNPEVVKKDPVVELNKLYVDFSAQIKENPDLRELGKAEFAKLEAGDPENRKLWEWFVEVSNEDFARYQALLKLLPFEYSLGESYYEEQMKPFLEELESKGLVSTGETGEKYVDLEDENLGRCILVKSDGATTYHMRDLPTFKNRIENLGITQNIYVVDTRQSHHFRQLFAVLRKAGYDTGTSRHIDFGFMSLPEGAISTRNGTVISLENLLGEANKQALQIINEKNPTLANKEEVAKQVGLASVKYFDLSHNRTSDIVFTWKAAVSFEGNTGPYLQYTHARIKSILRKAGDFEKLYTAETNQKTEELLRELCFFNEIVEQVSKDFLPSGIASYLFSLSQTFNSFYEAVPVLTETDPEKRFHLLTVCSATAETIRTGLYLLGIESPEEM